MKSTKKVLSVVLSLLMILSTVTCAFVVSAAPSTADYQSLADKLTPAVREALSIYTGSENNYTVSDPDGSVLAAADAYWTLVQGLYVSNASQSTSSNRTLTMIANTIKTNVQNLVAAEDKAAVGQAITTLSAGANISGSTNATSALAAPTVTLTVVLGENAILKYDSIAAMPAEIVVSKTYTAKHSSPSYQNGSGCNATTNYYVKVSGLSTDEEKVYKADFEGYEATFKKYEHLFDADLATLVAMSTADINTAVSELDTAYGEVAENCSVAVFEKYYGAYAEGVEALLPKVETAKAIQDTNATVIAALNSAVAAVDSTEDRAALVNLKNTINTNVSAYNAKAQAVKDFINYDFAPVNAALEEIQFKIDVIDVTAVIEKVDAAMAATDAYAQYDLEAAAEGEYDAQSGDIAVAYNNILTQYSVLKNAGSAAKAAVLGDEAEAYEAAAAARTAFMRELSALVGYSASVQAFLDSVAANYKDDVEKTYNQNLMAKLDYYEAKTADLENVVANAPADVDPQLVEVTVELARAKFAQVIGDVKAEIGAIATAQVDAAKAAFESTNAAQGGTVTLANLQNYKAFKAAVEALDVELYNYAKDKAIIADETVAAYDVMNSSGAIDDLKAFIATNGLDRYEQTEIADIVREPAETEVVRDKDYVVTDEKVDEIIDLLDKALASKEVNGLGVDLKSVLNADLLSALYTDDVVNAIVGLLYPLIANEFAKVWAGLPSEYTVEDGSTLNDMLKKDPVTFKLNIDDLETASKKLGLALFPNAVAEKINARYPGQYADVIATLNKCTTKSKDANPWEDQKILSEEGKLELAWGVTDRASFIQAIDAALCGLEPLLLALLANHQMGIDKDKEGAYAVSVGTGSGKATATILSASVTITIERIELNLVATANDGYNNLIVPIFEALGANVIPSDINNCKSTAEVIEKGLLVPVEAFLAQLAANPVATLTAALPNLAYALEVDVVKKLLSMIKTNISYSARAYASYKAVGGIINGNTTTDELMGDAIAIDVGAMFDLDSVEIGGAKLDLSSVNGLVNLVLGLLGDDVNLKLPKIDGAKLATLGKLTWKDSIRSEKTYEYGADGKAAYIEANKADVLIAVLKYVLKAAADPNFIPAIVALVGSLGGDAEEAEEAAFELPAIVEEILANVTGNPDMAIAAITELIFPQEYSPANGDINWLPAKAPVYDDYGNVIPTDSTTYPTEMWTREKAQYIVDNFPTFVNNIIMIAGVKIGDSEMLQNLPAVLDALLGGLYTAETANKLVDLLAGLVGDLDADLAALINEVVGIDVTAWAGMSFDFADGDRAAFVDAIVEILDPLAPVLKWIVAGENLTAKLSDENGKFQVVELQGYESYTNGIIPLVEALGATNVMAPAQFLADKDNIARNVINELLSAVDNLTADPYNKLLDLILNLVYFVASDGVTVVIDNVLHGVNAVLEIISPIYNINLENIIGLDIRFAKQDIISFLLETVNTMIYDKFGIELKLDYTASELFGDLAFGDVEEYTSANGKTAYRVTGVAADAADLLTVVGRYLIRQLVFSENTTAYAELAKEAFGLSEFSFNTLNMTLSLLAGIKDGPDYVLGVIFYIFFGADTAADAVADYYKYYSYDWAAIIKKMQDEDSDFFSKVGYLAKEVYEKTFSTILDDVNAPVNSDDVNSFIKFFRDIFAQIKAFFEKIGDFFRNLG